MWWVVVTHSDTRRVGMEHVVGCIALLYKDGLCDVNGCFSIHRRITPLQEYDGFFNKASWIFTTPKF
jgi:hypothetical protein